VQNLLVCRLSRLADGLLAFLAASLDPGLDTLSFFRADVNCAGCFGLRHFERFAILVFWIYLPPQILYDGADFLVCNLVQYRCFGVFEIRP
jgi:hypothetical protein